MTYIHIDINKYVLHIASTTNQRAGL